VGQRWGKSRRCASINGQRANVFTLIVKDSLFFIICTFVRSLSVERHSPDADDTLLTIAATFVSIESNVDAQIAARGPGERQGTVSVQGTASLSVPPDLALLTVGFEARGKSAREALDASNAAMTALMVALKRKGIDSRDAQTRELKLTPIHDKPSNDGGRAGTPAKIVDYEVGNTVVVTIRDVAKVGELIDAVVKAGANQIEDLNFAIKDRRPSLRDLRRRALADAREKAEDVAQEAGMQLGRPVSIDVDDMPSQAYSFVARSINPPFERSEAVPIAAGEEELSVSVQVDYELLPVK
jgi:uncharacterized protein YggE